MRPTSKIPLCLSLSPYHLRKEKYSDDPNPIKANSKSTYK